VPAVRAGGRDPAVRVPRGAAPVRPRRGVRRPRRGVHRRARGRPGRGLPRGARGGQRARRRRRGRHPGPRRGRARLPGPGLLMAPGWPADLSDGPLRLRPLRRGDQRDWLALRARNAAWLDPWEATPPTPGPAPTFAQYVRLLNRQAARGETLPFAIEYEG